VDRVLADKPMLGEMKGGVTTQRPDGYSGLHLSAEHGQLTVLAMLLRAGRSRDVMLRVTVCRRCSYAENPQLATASVLYGRCSQVCYALKVVKHYLTFHD